MSQITNGMRAIFSNPFIYDTFQNVMGATRIRREWVRDFIRPVPGMRVLDIGCGTAQILDLLPKDVAYWGYDISERYIAAAKTKFGSRGHFHCGFFDVLQVESLPKFDLVIALGVLHHLDDMESRSLFELAKRALVPEGRFVTMDPCISPGQNPLARFLINRDRGQNVRIAEAYRALPTASFSMVNGQLRHRSWIPYTHWIMECKL